MSHNSTFFTLQVFLYHLNPCSHRVIHYPFLVLLLACSQQGAPPGMSMAATWVCTLTQRTDCHEAQVEQQNCLGTGSSAKDPPPLDPSQRFRLASPGEGPRCQKYSSSSEDSNMQPALRTTHVQLLQMQFLQMPLSSTFPKF